MWKWWFSLFVCVCAREPRCKLCGGLSGKKQRQNKTCLGIKDVCVELYFKCVERDTAFIIH